MQIKSAEREGDDTAVSNSAQKVIRVKIKFEVEAKQGYQATINVYIYWFYTYLIYISVQFGKNRYPTLHLIT